MPNSRETLLNFPFRLILLCSLEWDPDPKTLTVETNSDPGKLYGSPALINIFYYNTVITSASVRTVDTVLKVDWYQKYGTDS